MAMVRAAPSLDIEEANPHTRILRVMLAVEDSISYFRAEPIPAPSERVRFAFEARWFGAKSEARVRTLLGDMALRFERYPKALAALRAWQPSREVASWVCHFHLQLADPIYRQFSGEYLPLRRSQGYANIDREAVARWVQERWPGKWSASTSVKFGSNLLATAFEAGLLRDRKDPRRLVVPRVPRPALAYLLYLLREVHIEGELLRSLYLTSVVPDASRLTSELGVRDGVRVAVRGDVQSFEWTYPDLMSWALAQREARDQESPAGRSLTSPTRAEALL